MMCVVLVCVWRRGGENKEVVRVTGEEKWDNSGGSGEEER